MIFIISASTLIVFFDLFKKTNYDKNQILDISEKYEDKYIENIVSNIATSFIRGETYSIKKLNCIRKHTYG